MGVPQGSILSVTLFGLKINSLVKAISPGVECSLYVNDFLICYRSKHIHIIERHLQQCLNKLTDWSDTNGFRFSSSKTVWIHLRKPHPEPILLLNGTLVPVVEETKFLGIVFDRKLTFIPHTKHLKDKCTKALNLLRVLAHTSWGADQESLLYLYRSLIRLQTWLWLHCLWICSWLLPAGAWFYSKPCCSFVLGSLQNFSRIQFICGSKWALSPLSISGEKSFHSSIA